MLIGLLAGIAAALCQSIAFVFSRLTAIRHNGHPLTILCMAHLLMGLFSLAILPFLKFESTPKILPNAGILLGMSLTYLVGMGFFFIAIRRVDASRATPILGMKVVFVAILTILFQDASFNLWQWTAIGFTLASIFFLNFSGGMLPWRSTYFILITALLYATSDMFIKKVIVEYQYLGEFNGLMFPCILNFVLCSIPSAIALFFFSNKSKYVWRGSFFFAIAFFSANFLIFYSISIIDVVYSNIAMSTRGVFSIIIGVLLAYLGVHDLETKVPKKVIIGRVIAGILMTASIALFSL